jgi:hypothetical protein
MALMSDSFKPKPCGAVELRSMSKESINWWKVMWLGQKISNGWVAALWEGYQTRSAGDAVRASAEVGNENQMGS